jgi:hypothetical protein
VGPGLSYQLQALNALPYRPFASGQFALPDDHNGETGALERFHRCSISALVPPQFRGPEVCVPRQLDFPGSDN